MSTAAKSSSTANANAQFTRAEAAIGQDKDQRPVPRSLQRVRTGREYRAQLIFSGHIGQRLRRAHSEPAHWIVLKIADLAAPAEERPKGTVRLVLMARALGLQANKELSNGESCG